MKTPLRSSPSVVSIRCGLPLTLAALLAAGCGTAPEDTGAPDSWTPPTPAHVLLLTVDTLRSDHLSSFGYPLQTTPYLDALLAGGVRFPRALAPVPRTTPALASLLTGAYPHSTGVRTLYDPLGGGVVSLAEVLKRRGYHTVAVVSNHMLVPERRLDRGFDVYDNADDARDAAATTAAALRRAGATWRDRPVFLWVHYIDPHVPYLPTPELAARFDPGYRGRYAAGFGTEPGGIGDRAYPGDLPKWRAVFANPLPPEVNAHVRRLYAADVRATDDQIGRLIEGLKTRVRNDWLVVFTADHGESLGEHDFFYDHGDYVYNASLQVPLGFVLPPGDSRARDATVDDWVSLVDVAPTLIELLDLNLDAQVARRIEGRSLMPLLEGGSLPPRPVFAESGHSFYPDLVRRRTSFDLTGRFRTVVLGDWKLIWTPGQTPDKEFELYHLASDPGETVDLYRPDHPWARVLVEHLRDWYRESGEGEHQPGEEDLRRLRSLGYLE